jgi:hypothetical protein
LPGWLQQPAGPHRTHPLEIHTMKFIVRAGFVIHDTKTVEINGQKTEQTNSYYEGGTVDFDEATALAHLHKLEPVDKAATAFCAARAAIVTQPAAPQDPAAFSAAVAQAVSATLAALGIKVPEAAAPQA